MRKAMALILVILAALLAWGMILLSDAGAEEMEYRYWEGEKLVDAPLYIEVPSLYPDMLLEIRQSQDGTFTVECEGLIDILSECLEYIEDGSDKEVPNPLRDNYLTVPGVYIIPPETITEEGRVTLMQNEIKAKERELKRLERETALHGKLIKTIQTLKGESK